MTNSNLSTAKVGDTVYVNNIIGNNKLTTRLMEMGLTKGVKILIKKIAPFGDPIAIEFRGYCLSIRKNTAKNIITKKTKT